MSHVSWGRFERSKGCVDPLGPLACFFSNTRAGGNHKTINCFVNFLDRSEVLTCVLVIISRRLVPCGKFFLPVMELCAWQMFNITFLFSLFFFPSFWTVATSKHRQSFVKWSNKMPKNKGKGGKNYKKGKKRDEGETRRDLIFKEDGQEYAQVLRMLGDGRLALQCFDGVARTGLIRGTMRRRVWM